MIAITRETESKKPSQLKTSRLKMRHRHRTLLRLVRACLLGGLSIQPPAVWTVRLLDRQ